MTKFLSLKVLAILHPKGLRIDLWDKTQWKIPLTVRMTILTMVLEIPRMISQTMRPGMFHMIKILTDSNHEQESFISGSEVIIKQTSRSSEEEYTDDIKTLTKHPAFHSYVQSLVNENVKKALSESGSVQKKHRSSVETGNMTKRVVKNPKSPSDTTIYAPTLNLTPEKHNRNLPDHDPNNVAQKFLNL